MSFKSQIHFNPMFIPLITAFNSAMWCCCNHSSWYYWHHCGILPGPTSFLWWAYTCSPKVGPLPFIHEVFNYNNHLLAYFVFPASFHSFPTCITALPSDNKDSDLPNLLPIKNNSHLHRLSSTYFWICLPTFWSDDLHFLLFSSSDPMQFLIQLL